MSNKDSNHQKDTSQTQSAYRAHMQYASETVGKWPEWKQNVLAHTRPETSSASYHCKSDGKQK